MQTEGLEPLLLDELDEGLPEVRQSPKDQGILKTIGICPQENQQISLTQCHLSPELGLEGDHWAKGPSPHPDTQVTLMNVRVIALIAQQESRWSLAGDILYVDLDLSDENVPCGQRLSIGSVVLEVTDRPHTECGKFAKAFGEDARRFVNSPEGSRLNLRGIYAKIVQAGTVKVGDKVRKQSRGSHENTD
jgi:MOSC domain-containing protein YiiM